MPDPVVRLIEVAELRLAAEAAGVSSISREEGWLVVRFGASLTPGDRDAAARRAGAAGRPAERRHVRQQPGPAAAPGLPRKAWTLTQAVVARLTVEREPDAPQPVTVERVDREAD